MFRAINLREKSSSGVWGRALANDKVMLDPTRCEKTLRLVRKINRNSGVFKVIENLKIQ